MTEKKPACIITAIILFLTLMSLIVPLPARALEPVELKHGVDQYSLGLHLEYLEDKSGTLTISDVSSPAYSTKFLKNKNEILNFGTTESVIWTRFALKSADREGQWLLINRFPAWHVTLCSPEDQGWKCSESGHAIPFNQREIKHWSSLFKVGAAGETVTYYFRVNAPVILIKLDVFSMDRFIDHAQTEAIIFSFVTGLIFLLFLFNATAGIFLRQISYIYLSLFIILKQFFIITVGDLLFYLLWPDHEMFNAYINLAFICICMVPLILYIYSVTSTRKDYPKFYYFLNFMIGCFLTIPLVQFYNVYYAYYLSHLVGTVIGVFVIILIILFIRNKKNTYFWCGMMVFMIGEFIPDLIVMGVLSSIELWWYVRIIAHVFTSILFTFSVINQYRTTQREKAAAQAETLRVQADAVATLEEKVKERTAELADSNRRLSSIGDRLKRYLPVQLVSSIITGGKATGSLTERRKITVFFSDIKSFTDTTDSLEAEELSSLLNEYLTEMTMIAAKHGGTIDKFIGDAVMIFFGAPESLGDKEDALRCLRMAVEMQGRMKELQAKWFNQGIERPLQIRIGINTGVATVGDFGAEERLSYTTIGGQVNLASRLESLCEPGGILISHATWALVKDEFPCRPCGEKQVKGIHHSVLVYEVAMG